MTPERKAEQDAHDTLRDSIRTAAVALHDRLTIEDADETEPEYRDAMTSGVLVDYVVVAVFDTGDERNHYTAILRTDGKAARYRTRGLLSAALDDT